MPAPVASGWSGSPGGACTRWKSAALSRRTWIADLRQPCGEAELVAWHPDVIVAMGTIDARPVADEAAAGTVAFERRARLRTLFSFPGLALSCFCECRDASKRLRTSGRAA